MQRNERSEFPVFLILWEVSSGISTTSPGLTVWVVVPPISTSPTPSGITYRLTMPTSRCSFVVTFGTTRARQQKWIRLQRVFNSSRMKHPSSVEELAPKVGPKTTGLCWNVVRLLCGCAIPLYRARMILEQNFGPHMPQNSVIYTPAGNVSS